MLTLFPEIKSQGIDFIDVGCSGELDSKWKCLVGVLNFIGFDPNKEECDRLASQASRYLNTRYLPYAVSGKVGNAKMHITKSPYCYSLLQPRHKWLKRFKFHDLFTETGETFVECVTLDQICDEHKLNADIIKLDTQGLELPILKEATKVLKHAFCVETETGFVENYIGETTAAQIDEYMRQHGFLIFDIKINRMARANQFSHRSKNQPLWCETLWLRDYLASESWGMAEILPNKIRAKKAIFICNALGFTDYGYELAEYFHTHELLDDNEFKMLSNKNFWLSHNRENGLLNNLVRLLPMRARKELFNALAITSGKPHLLKKAFQRNTKEVV